MTATRLLLSISCFSVLLPGLCGLYLPRVFEVMEVVV